ncbi:cardiolipin synthase [Pseudoclavibacter sp. 13-3]|uniref:cardiolipin synthase n=1 Tax=Pseudoclavibacter sp. 13-3 TaxID=2901228 RepID=UPI001E298628|nr:cardiolipin synthase [Pseudoclavibacter sp. 13-3]MCD7100937.1 cardiolipin synthase [Pseudoclavibacter sp. 13-3]
MSDYQTWFTLPTLIFFTTDLVIRVVALFVVPRNRTPASGTAWLLFIFLLPIPGLIVFLLIGANRMPRARREKQDRVISQMQKAAAEDAKVFGSDLARLPPGLENTEKLGLDLGAQPMMAGNRAHITYQYEESIEAMASAIRTAEKYVHVEFYILSYDRTTHDVFEAIREATARGVKVRVMLDHIATIRQPKPSATTRKLDEVGAQWAFMLPVRPWRGQWQRPDLRNHRKILVVDGHIGFIGSQNMVDTSYNKPGNLRRGLKWRDIMVRVTGPIVSSLNRVFMGDWYIETGELLEDSAPHAADSEQPGELLDCQVLPSGPGFGEENNLQVFIALMGTATRRISVTSPYFVPDQAIMYALRAATARGVAVELFVSETGDQPMVYHAQRSYYEALLRAGVRIFMFKPPYILHSKHFTIDDSIAVVGSSNMDQRSFSLNMEVSMVVNGAGFVRQLDRVNAYYHENSRELTLEEWKKQPLRSQLLDGLFRLTSALQ